MQRKVKIFWGIVGLLGMAFIVFNNFNQSLVILKGKPEQWIALLISGTTMIIYGIHNRNILFN